MSEQNATELIAKVRARYGASPPCTVCGGKMVNATAYGLGQICFKAWESGDMEHVERSEHEPSNPDSDVFALCDRLESMIEEES